MTRVSTPSIVSTVIDALGMKLGQSLLQLFLQLYIFNSFIKQEWDISPTLAKIKIQLQK
jgi:hypothetical protein